MRTQSVAITLTHRGIVATFHRVDTHRARRYYGVSPSSYYRLADLLSALADLQVVQIKPLPARPGYIARRIRHP